MIQTLKTWIPTCDWDREAHKDEGQHIHFKMLLSLPKYSFLIEKQKNTWFYITLREVLGSGVFAMPSQSSAE